MPKYKQTDNNGKVTWVDYDYDFGPVLPQNVKNRLAKNKAGKGYMGKVRFGKGVPNNERTD